MPDIGTDLITLRDGRRLEFGCYGDERGLPCLFFHGFIGSHHQAAFAHEAAARHGLRIVAVNRPGVGRSSPRRRQVIRECVGDVKQLVDRMGWTRFAAFGASGGAPYALAVAAGLRDRVRLATLLSGLGPVSEAALYARMNRLAKLALGMGRWLPWAVHGFLGWRTREFHRDPDGFLTRLIGRWSHSDRALFERPEVRAAFIGDLSEVLVHGTGAAGLAQELGLYFRWGFGLDDVPPELPVILWHGRHDVLVPAMMSEYVGGRLKNAQIHLRPGGHFMAVSHAEEIMSLAREMWERG